MNKKTDPAAFLKKLSPEALQLTSQQKELLEFIEKNPDTKLVLRPLKRETALLDPMILGYRPASIIIDEID